jgi:HSP20 family molecular chaperone IbpA
LQPFNSCYFRSFRKEKTMFGTLAPRRSGLARTEPRTSFLEEIEDAMQRMWDSGPNGWTFGASVPSLDVSETDKAVEVKLDVPGVTAKEIDIQLNGNVLTVSGERKEEQEKRVRHSIASSGAMAASPARLRCLARSKRTRWPPSIATACLRSHCRRPKKRK